MTARSILHFLAPCAALLAALACPPANARATVRDPVHNQRVTPAQLRHALKAYDRWLIQLEEHRDTAGMATAVIADGHVAYERTLGYADARAGIRVTPNTVFRIASLSKAFASALTGLLVDNGSLRWDTRLTDVLPFFDLNNDDATQQATVGDILGQRLGLPRNTYDLLLEANEPYPKLARELDQVHLRCQVGTCYSYQNVAFSLIGDVIHARTGDFYGHEVERRLFLPLGMTTATYGLQGLENSASWARPHRRTRAGWRPFTPREAYYRVAPAAGVNASLRDMEQWLIAQMGGRPDVLPAALLRTLHTPGIATPSELHATPWRRARLDDAHYALGWRIYDYAGQRLIFHAGAVNGYRAMIGFLPAQKVGIVMLWNAGTSRPAGLFPMFLDQLLGLQPRDWANLERRRHTRR
ncbi:MULTISPECIES: serine hydrolase domain-containing protein [Oleiagrimonas]|uniref:Beta-lactamase family protein n=1 Tax=Oleiagrimonas citrea TaxID=1665687 RepID=A0A846ZJV8_9GAMM|nr:MULTISPECIES: serine hydrolase domain-containing protein [Oleiagrimonas]NKZ38256.1 beta-lactamase family protein [Oleiagrimonas citrea]